MKKIILFLILLALVAVAIAAKTSGGRFLTAPKTNDGSPEKPTVVAQTDMSAFSVDFEDETVVASAQQFFDEIKTALPSGQVAGIPIQYEAGTSEDRAARIIPDPTQEGNQVLQFWIKNATVPGARPGFFKGRVQIQIAGMEQNEAFARFRMYLPPDLEHYQAFPKENKWFVVSEAWSGTGNDPYRFLIGLDIIKESGSGKPLHFLVSGEKRVGGTQQNGKWETVWGTVNNEFEIPVGEWIEIETGYKQGDKDTGRYYLSAKRPSDPSPVTIFDITNWTYHPSAPKPVPLTQWNPLKLYTSGEIIDYIRNQGGTTQIYWDDLELYDSWAVAEK